MNSKIVVFEKAGEPLKILSTEIPALGPGEILVRNEYATLCRSDISTYTGKRIEKSPTILGHEIVGRIAATAPGEHPLKAHHQQESYRLFPKQWHRQQQVHL